jgi:hypothetical protein
MSEWTHRFTAVKPCPTYASRCNIKVEAGLHHLEGNSRPYFSVTGEIYRPGARDCECCGCIHDEIAKHWPELQPIIALHLSDDTGMPMHGAANSWYQLAGYYNGAGERYHAGNNRGNHSGQYREPTPDECLQSFADYVRIPIEEAQALAEQWRCDDDYASTKRWFMQWFAGQADRFQREADEGKALLDRLIANKL